MTQNVLTNDEAVTFITFERYVTNLRGTFVLVPISTHPSIQNGASLGGTGRTAAQELYYFYDLYG
jgi:hypothetical protein